MGERISGKARERAGRSQRLRESLKERRYWVFDLDGTLTRKTHDFGDLRRRLGMPPSIPILEWIRAQEPAQVDVLLRRIRLWELEHAARARPAEGALALLSSLSDRGCVCGVLTRNHTDIALSTLEGCGLGSFFKERDVFGRDLAAPKPSPEGINRLLWAWGGRPEQAVMTGDFRYDIEAGRSAGVLTVLVRGAGPAQKAPRSEDWGADLVLDNLLQLLPS